MGPRQKAQLFHSLAQLIRSGTPFHKAIGVLAETSSGSVKAMMRRIQKSVEDGSTASEALQRESKLFGSLEMGVITASERAGRLEKAFAHLSEYYEKQAQVRSHIIRKAAYPVFLIHFGILLAAVPAVFQSGDFLILVWRVLWPITQIWLVIFALVVIFKSIMTLAFRSVAIDRILWAIPLFGKVRKGFALSRFFAAYEMQIDSGTNMLACLEEAARAGNSAIINNVIQKILPEVAAGGRVGPLLAKSKVFPQDSVRAILVGEETGKLDAELLQLAEHHRLAAITRMETISEWLPKALFILVALYIAWNILNGYKATMSDLNEVMK